MDYFGNLAHQKRLPRARAERILDLRHQGLTYREIGVRMSISYERVRQIYMEAQTYEQRQTQRTKWRLRVLSEWDGPNKGRPLDMGGPRDEWIERDPWSEV